jgi:hypothetical protein
METIHMSQKGIPRAGVLRASLAGKTTNRERARALRSAVRPFQRLEMRFSEEGLRVRPKGPRAVALLLVLPLPPCNHRPREMQAPASESAPSTGRVLGNEGTRARPARAGTEEDTMIGEPEATG